MNSFIVVFAAALAVASAGVISPVGVISQTVVSPAVKESLIQGPSTSTHIVGPDGSQIVANAPGAQIRTAESVGVASEVVSPVAAYAAPVAYAASPVAYASHVAAPVAYSAPVAYAAHGLVASPVLANGYPVLAAGSGLEGQYVQDINEKLYDDGSYKGEIYA